MYAPPGGADDDSGSGGARGIAAGPLTAFKLFIVRASGTRRRTRSGRSPVPVGHKLAAERTRFMS